MHVYCVKLSAIKPGTGERQTIIVNQVPAEHREQARDEAINRLSLAHPECRDSILCLDIRRTDDAFWNGES